MMKLSKLTCPAALGLSEVMGESRLWEFKGGKEESRDSWTEGLELRDRKDVDTQRGQKQSLYRIDEEQEEEEGQARLTPC